LGLWPGSGGSSVDLTPFDVGYRVVVNVREAADRLSELRTALISAAVTGTIDVSDRETVEGSTA